MAGVSSDEGDATTGNTHRSRGGYNSPTPERMETSNPGTPARSNAQFLAAVNVVTERFMELQNPLFQDIINKLDRLAPPPVPPNVSPSSAPPNFVFPSSVVPPGYSTGVPAVPSFPSTAATPTAGTYANPQATFLGNSGQGGQGPFIGNQASQDFFASQPDLAQTMHLIQSLQAQINHLNMSVLQKAMSGNTNQQEGPGAPSEHRRL